MRREAGWILIGTMSALLAGCAGAGMQGVTDCRAVKGSVVKVTSKRGELSAKPECIDVERGKTFIVRFKDKPSAGTARIRPDGQKNPKATWLKRAKGASDDIVVEVPAEPKDGDCDETECYFKYEIEVDGIGKLDPRVRVR